MVALIMLTHVDCGATVALLILLPVAVSVCIISLQISPDATKAVSSSKKQCIIMYNDVYKQCIIMYISEQQMLRCKAKNNVY